MANAIFGRQGARLVAAGRVALGVGMVARPELFPKVLGIDSGTAARMGWFGRMFGAREVALGAGLLLAGRNGSGEREWLLAGAVSDAVDAAAFAEALRRGLVRRPLAAAFAGTALAATGTEVVAWLDARD